MKGLDFCLFIIFSTLTANPRSSPQENTAFKTHGQCFEVKVGSKNSIVSFNHLIPVSPEGK